MTLQVYRKYISKRPFETLRGSGRYVFAVTSVPNPWFIHSDILVNCPSHHINFIPPMVIVVLLVILLVMIISYRSWCPSASHILVNVWQRIPLSFYALHCDLGQQSLIVTHIYHHHPSLTPDKTSGRTEHHSTRRSQASSFQPSPSESLKKKTNMNGPSCWDTFNMRLWAPSVSTRLGLVFISLTCSRPSARTCVFNSQPFYSFPPFDTSAFENAKHFYFVKRHLRLERWKIDKDERRA